MIWAVVAMFAVIFLVTIAHSFISSTKKGSQD